MRLSVEKNDIKKAVYFITNLTQMQGNRPMQGALSSKGDFMGGIFDRWINIIPESIIFNKVILPSISNGRNVEVITDYYDYNPKKVGIAPDVIGIRVDGVPIPFVHFDEEWKQVENRPLIEVKTFKKNQFMFSLRNQEYDNKYLVVIVSSFDVDYLVPLMDHSLFEDSVYDSLHMDDATFIISNSHGLICQPHKVNSSKSTIGFIDLVGITKASDFMDYCNLCHSGVTPEYVKVTKKYTKKKAVSNSLNISLSSVMQEYKPGLFRFNNSWYETREINRDKQETLDLAISDIDAISIKKINKTGMYIESSSDCMFAGTALTEGVYKVEFGKLSRGSNTKDEFFMNKSTAQLLPNKETELKNTISSIINTI